MYIRLIVFLCFLAFGVNAQKTCSPQEIQDVLKNSDFTYQLGGLDGEVTPKDYSNKLNSSEYHKNGKGEVVKYPASDDFVKAKSLLKQGSIQEAKDALTKVLGQFPKHAAAMTLMANAFAKEGSTANAEQWFQKAITANYSDYKAHLGLANLYAAKGNSKQAVDEITIAHILNRNEASIFNSLKTMCSKQGVDQGDWTFQPQIAMEEKEGKKLEVKFNMAWMGYALPKAIRTYEPGHVVSSKDHQILLANEKEGLIAMLPAGMRDTKVMRTPEFKFLKKSIDNQVFEEFIYYEIILREHPEVAYQLTQKEVEKIRDYVLSGRG